MLRIIWLSVCCVWLLSCENDPSPRPKGYFKIDFPEKKYRVFDSAGYPYTFEYPVYAKVVQDSTFFDDKPENPFWINIDFPQFGGRLHVSYKQIGVRNRFDKLVEDAFKMTSKHSLKATSIDEIPIHPSADVHGFIFEVGGNAATGKQFFVTDSVQHFLRGALYFDATPNADSLKPVYDFLYADMQHLIKTLRWKN